MKGRHALAAAACAIFGIGADSRWLAVIFFVLAIGFLIRGHFADRT